MTSVAADLKDRRQAVRQKTDRVVVIIQGQQNRETRAIDISLTGIKIAIVPGVVPGARVGIDFGTGPFAASVTWADQAAAGLRFAQALREIPAQPDERDAAKAA